MPQIQRDSSHAVHAEPSPTTTRARPGKRDGLPAARSNGSAFDVVRGPQWPRSNAGAVVQRMQNVAVARIKAVVSAHDHEITGLRVDHRHRCAPVALADSRVRHRDAVLREHVHRETGAVEAAWIGHAREVRQTVRHPRCRARTRKQGVPSSRPTHRRNRRSPSCRQDVRAACAQRRRDEFGDIGAKCGHFRTVRYATLPSWIRARMTGDWLSKIATWRKRFGWVERYRSRCCGVQGREPPTSHRPRRLSQLMREASVYPESETGEGTSDPATEVRPKGFTGLMGPLLVCPRFGTKRVISSPHAHWMRWERPVGLLDHEEDVRRNLVGQFDARLRAIDAGEHIAVES